MSVRRNTYSAEREDPLIRPLNIMIADQWTVDSKYLTLDGQPVLSRPQPILRNALDVQIGILPSIPRAPHQKDTGYDYLHVFCQFPGCLIEKFTVQVYIKLLNIKSRNVMFRCDISRGFQRTPLYPIIARQDWDDFYSKHFATVVAYEVCVFMSIQLPKLSPEDLVLEEPRVIHKEPPADRPRYQIKVQQRTEEYLNLDTAILEQANILEELQKQKRYRRKDAIHLKIMLKYIYYKIVPTQRQITSELLEFLRRFNMRELLEMCIQVERYAKLLPCLPILHELCRKIYGTIPKPFQTMDIPTVKDFGVLMTLNAGIARKSKLQIAGRCFNMIFDPYFDSTTATDVAGPSHATEYFRPPKSKRRKKSKSKKPVPLSEMPEICGEMFVHDSHIYGMKTRPSSSATAPSLTTMSATMSGISELPSSYQLDQDMEVLI